MSGTPAVNTTTAFGPGVDTSVYARGGYFLLPSNDPLRLQPPLTLAWAGSAISTATQYGNICGVAHNGTDTAPYNSYTLRSDTTYYAFDTNNGNYQPLTGAVVTHATRGQRTLVGVFNASTTKELWVDGRLDGTLGVAGGATTYHATDARFSIATQTVSGRDPGTAFAIMAVWNRALTPNQIGAFHADPTQLLEP